MLRSRSHNARSLMELIRDNPFLCAAFLAGIAWLAFQAEVGSSAFFGLMWRILGFGFHLTASWPQKLMTDLSGWLEVALSVILGLIPYLLADIVWRHIRNR